MTDSLTIMASPLTMDSLQIDNLRQEYDYDSQIVSREVRISTCCAKL